MLRRSHARDLCDRLDKLRARVERGRYDDNDLSELAYILKSIRNHLTGNDARLSEVIGIPGKTIAAAYAGKSRPKYTNFMRMVHGARQICLKEIERTSVQLTNVEGAEAVFPEQW